VAVGAASLPRRLELAEPLEEPERLDRGDPPGRPAPRDGHGLLAHAPRQPAREGVGEEARDLAGLAADGGRGERFEVVEHGGPPAFGR
jgi:hypothetical protein